MKHKSPSKLRGPSPLLRKPQPHNTNHATKLRLRAMAEKKDKK